MSTAKALVLDFGGVISRTMFETHHLSEAALGLEPGSLTWRGPFEPASDPLWLSMQRGEISERDYWMARTVETGRRIGREWTRMEDFVAAARGDDPAAIIRPEARNAIMAAAAAGRRLAILSNELDLFYGAGLRARLPLLDRFDLIVDATHTGILKPDPRAYAFVTGGLGLEAGDCVFVDDQARNVAGARQAGMLAVHFDVTDPEASYRRALALLGTTA